MYYTFHKLERWLNLRQDIKTSDNNDRLRKGSKDKRKGTSETLVSHEKNWRGDPGKQDSLLKGLCYKDNAVLG